MNDTQLAIIEERWMKASGGPWTCDRTMVQPRKKRGKFYTSAEAIERFQRACQIPSDNPEPIKLESVTVRNYEEALEFGLVKDIEGWVKLLDEDWPNLDGERLLQNCAVIYTSTQKEIARYEKDQDKIAVGGDSKGLTCPPALAILNSEQDGECRTEDLEFLLHAPEDMGTLVTAVHKQKAEIETLKANLKKARQETEDAQALKAKALQANKAIRKVAQQILEAS